MTQVSAIDSGRFVNTYNAVNIRINKPQITVPEELDKDSVYNPVNLEINEPKIVSEYSYPESRELVTYDIAAVKPIETPVLPAPQNAYHTDDSYKNRTTWINNKFIFEENFQPIKQEESIVPPPVLTTTEDEKAAGVSFQRKERKPIEIIPPVDIVPEVNINTVVLDLNSDNFDIQAKQMEEIVKAVASKDNERVYPYIVTDVFTSLINIIKKDVSDLTPPNEEQIEIRKKIIINEIISEQARLSGQNPDEIKLPFEISEEEFNKAIALSDLEQAERNKEYAITTTALLAKVYVDEIEKQSGNIVPLADVPGVSAIVDALRYDSNSGVKVAAVDALRYLKRPEYNDEIASVLKIVAEDENPYAAKAAEALQA